MSNITKKPVPTGQPTTTTSSTTTHQEYTAPAEEEPPAYSSPPVVAGPSNAPPLPRRKLIPGLPNIVFSRYAIPNSELSEDQTTLTTYVSAFSSNPMALVNLVNEQLTLPPRPHIRIVGRQSAGQQQPDFHFKMNMMRYLLPADSSRWNYVKLVSDGEMAFRGGSAMTVRPSVSNGLRDWAARFCRDQASLKTFTMERQVTNWNTEYLEGQIRSIVAATGYQGHVTVSFITGYSKIIVRPPLKGNKLWTNITNIFQEEKKYEVVKAIWPYANQAPGSGNERKCAVQSEESWWSDWKEVVRWAVMAKKRGWLSLDDLMEMEMGPKDNPKPSYDWDSWASPTDYAT